MKIFRVVSDDLDSDYYMTYVMASDIEEAKTKIYKEINESLDKIGIEETKKIIRQINRELRDMSIED